MDRGRLAEKKALRGGPSWGLAALAWTFAGVLFAAGRYTTLQTHALTTAAGWQAVTSNGGWTGSRLAIRFGNDFVAHENIPKKLSKDPVFEHTARPAGQCPHASLLQ
jgi:hypothetical protein